MNSLHGSIICLLHHCSVLGFGCLHCLSITFAFACYVTIISLLSPLLFVSLLYYLFHISIVSLSVCCVIALCSASTVTSSVYYVTMLFLQGFHCFVICLLRHCFVHGFDCFIFCLSHHYTISVWIALFHLLCVTSLYYPFKVSFVALSVFTSLLPSRLRLFDLLFVTCTSLFYLFKVFIVFVICLLRHCSVLCFSSL